MYQINIIKLVITWYLLIFKKIKDIIKNIILFKNCLKNNLNYVKKNFLYENILFKLMNIYC